MDKRLIGCVSVAALVAADGATAADLPIKTPPMSPAFSWTACYLGGYIGDAWDVRRGATFSDQGQNGLGAAGSTATPAFQSYSGGVVAARIVPPHSWNDALSDSPMAGGTLGCNWQPAGSPLVLGVEGEFGTLNMNGQTFDPNTVVSTQTIPDVLGSARVGDWYGMVTGRLGYAVNRVLFYAKGGVAFIPTQASVADSCQSTGCGNWLISTSGSNIASTWTAGGGIEWAFAQNWSVKAEYMFIGLGDNSGFRSCGNVTTPAGTTVAGGPFCFNNSFGGIQTIKMGLNFRFN